MFSSIRTALLCLLCLPAFAHAWGAAGHQLIAELAFERLPSSTREKVSALLALEPGATLPSISTWADEVRSPSTAAWHYLNFERGGACAYDEQKNCPDGQCIVKALERQIDALSNARSPEDQLRALKWVVHLVGDIHQPLHSGFYDDKGGNLYQVRAFGRGTNMHSLWDGRLIDNWPGGLSALRTEVDAVSRTAAPATPRLWAEESCRVASAADFYPDGRFIDEEYRVRWAPVVASRLASAANGLAYVLARVLP